jgi:hypothetical protein
MQLRNGKTRLNGWEKSLLLLILLAAFLLSIKQLYPLNSFDEAEMMNWSKDLETDLFPGFKFPPLFLYLHYLLSLLYRGILSFMGIIGSTKDFLDTEWGYRFTVEAGRVVSAIFGTLTVYVTFKLGKEYYGKAVGFAAALLLACNPLVILYSHIFRPDILVALLMTIFVFYLLKYMHTPKISYIFWAGFFYGLSVAGKFNVFPVILAFVLTVFINYKKNDANGLVGNRKPPLKKLFLYIPLGAAAGFFAGAPNWLINPIGNIKKFLMQYSPGQGKIYLPYEIKGPLGTYSDIATDLSGYFGLILFVLLLVGIMVAFLTRNKNDMVISATVLSYFMLFGFFGFYASRYGLPPYPLMALLMVKVLLVDLKNFYRYISRRWTGLPPVQTGWRYITTVLFILLGGFAVYHTMDNIKNYNLLKTQLSWDRAIEYRENHNILDPQFNVGRQIYTPKIPKRNIKLTKRFYPKFDRRDRQKTLHFIQAHRETYEEYLRDKEWQKDRRTINIEMHRPFYRIKKPQYQPWHPESIFLYRLPEALRNINPPPKRQPHQRLPRTFYCSGNTNYLPLQVYEKNPNFIKMDGQYHRHWLYSKKKLEKIVFRFFTQQKNSTLTITVNGTGKTFNIKTKAIMKSTTKSTITTIEIDNIRPKMFFHDYVYDVQLDTPDDKIQRAPYYIVMEPVYVDTGKTDKAVQTKETQKPSFSFDNPLDGQIPRLFRDKVYPDWVVSFYRETGIDLSLLTFIRTHHLYTNPCQDMEDISVDFFPLEKGYYFIRLEAEKIVEAYPFGSTAFLEYETRGSSGGHSVRVNLEGQFPAPIPIEVTEALVFTRINIKELRLNNYFIKRVTLVPDFRESLKQH